MTNHFPPHLLSLSLLLTSTEDLVHSPKLNNKKLLLKLISCMNLCFNVVVSTGSGISHKFRPQLTNNILVF